MAILTNQSGIGRAFFDEARLAEIHNRLLRLLQEREATVEAIYVCPHLPSDNCSCRKPRPGLVYRAARELGFAPSQCVVVGDKLCDIELGLRVGALTFLVRTGYGSEVESQGMVQAHFVVNDLCDVAATLESLYAMEQSRCSPC